MKETRIITSVLMALAIGIPFTHVSGQMARVPQGAINGLFTINNEGDQVYFSQGNLQYIGSAKKPYWKFADHQWDIIGRAQDGGTPEVDRDLFAWGTSGQPHRADCYQPWSCGIEAEPFNPYNGYYDLDDKDGSADWGYNPISNGGNKGKQWRTPTAGDLYYIFEKRKTPTGIRFAKGIVNDINGYIIVPDDWSRITYTLQRTDDKDAPFSSNVFTVDEWSVLEEKGLVFLPAAGKASIYAPREVNVTGNYWTANGMGDGMYKKEASNIFFSNDWHCLSWCREEKCSRNAVRLVQDAK